MIRFAIVDDNPSDASILSQYLNSYFEKLGVVFSVDTFQDGPSFLEAFHSQYDMIFLDVEMSPLDGFAVAERIREKNDSTLLVFVTNMSQLARQGYKYQAFDYLPKPSDFSEFKMTLDRAALQSKSNEDKTTNKSCYAFWFNTYLFFRMRDNNLYSICMFFGTKPHNIILNTRNSKSRTNQRDSSSYHKNRNICSRVFR